MHDTIVMTWRYSALAFVTLALLVLCRSLARPLHAGLGRPYKNPITALNDPESRLALGKTIPLGCADLSSLVIIPGVSDKLAQALLEKRHTILATAKTAPLRVALQHARGVGDKISTLLTRYISLDLDYSCAPEYLPFEPHQRPPAYRHSDTHREAADMNR